MKEWPLAVERELLADACVPFRHPHSLWNFVRLAAGWYFKCKERKKYWLTEREHRPLLDDLQARIEQWKQSRDNETPIELKVIICVFRGFGKTNSITTTVPLYAALDEPNMMATIGSETHPKAQKMLRGMKPLMDGTDPMSWFAWFYGNWYDKERTWNEEAVVHAYRTATSLKEPSIGTFGVETGITGQHPLLCIYDDPLTEEKLNDGGVWNEKAIRSLRSISYALQSDVFFALVGTRYREDDPIGTALRDSGVASWHGHAPIESYQDDPDGYHVYFLQARDRANTANFSKGEPTLPEAGLDNRWLEADERKQPIQHAAQMMNNPELGEHVELTREQVEKLIIDRTDLPAIEYATIHLDTAFKEDKRRGRGDRNAIVVWLHAQSGNGQVFFDRAVYSAEWRSEEFDVQLVRILHDLRRRGIRVRAITDEKEVGGKRGVYLNHLRQIIGAAGLFPPEILQLNRGGKNKVIRIREASNYWLGNFVRLLRDADGLNELIHEMLRIGGSHYDDISDAAADVFRPEIWRSPIFGNRDDQPDIPYQPGDEYLKNRYIQDMQDLETEIRTGKQKDEDIQPYESYMEERNLQ